MVQISFNVKRKPNWKKIESNWNFGVASGLTATVKEAQKDVINQLPNKFTLRGVWWKPRNKFGIKIRPAKKVELTKTGKTRAEVRTQADWLVVHETGGIKRRFKSSFRSLVPANYKFNKSLTGQGRIAIPTRFARPTFADKMLKSRKPPRLKRSFIQKMGSTEVLFQKKGRKKRADVVPKFILVKNVFIRRNSAFLEPGEKSVDKNLLKNLLRSVTKAYAGIK